MKTFNHLEFGKKALIHAPATIANINCGFDVLGMALHHPFDIMEMTLMDQPGIRIKHRDEFGLPEDLQQNVAGVALQSLMKQCDGDFGFEVEIHKKIKPGSGLGSSAASSAGAVVGANFLLGNIFSKAFLLECAMDGEVLAGGTRHGDNAAAAIYGGIALVVPGEPQEVVSFEYPPLWVSVLHPLLELRTSMVRSILPKEVTLRDAISQWGHLAGLVAAFYRKDYKLIARCLQDIIIEPVRSVLIPGFDEIKNQCSEAGALGTGIAGAGPSVFSLAQDKSTADKLAHIMQQIFQEKNIAHHCYVSEINAGGISCVAG